MRSTMKIFMIGLLLCATSAWAQQPDLYSQINPLETAVNNGTATRAQQLDLAKLYIQAGRFYEAQQIGDKLLAIDPNDADAKTLRDQASKGITDIQMAQVAQAEARAKSAVATDQDRLALADAYYQSGSYAAAADIYAHLPASVMTRDERLRYARSLAWSNQLDQSERVYNTLLMEQPTPDLQLEYGRVLSWMGAQKASVDELTRIYNQTHTEDALIALANAKAWSGDRQGALQLLDQYMQSNPNSTQARQLEDQLRASPDLQIERVSRLIDVEPYNLALRVERAQLEMQAGRDSEALNDAKFVRDHTMQKIAALDQIESQA
jgi:thioredoxin-like negative regulator of GroEL